MYRWRATNYSMGNVVKQAEFEASSPERAMRIAEKLVPGNNGLGMGGRKAAIIGVKYLGVANQSD